ncbi:hypothetical protein ACVNIS_24845 (plasmid) [Sphaerotilaceae bacterium SBD11-9]
MRKQKRVSIPADWPTIQARISPDMKNAVRGLALRRGLSETELLVDVVARELALDAGGTEPEPNTFRLAWTPATSAAFEAAAARRGLTPHEALLSLIGREIEASAGLPDPPATGDPTPCRVTLSVPAFVRDEAAGRARRRDMAMARWIAALLQSNVLKLPVLLEDELQRVDLAARQLAALGKNLNQVAKALNQAYHETDRVKLDELAALRRAVTETRDAIRTLIQSSRNVWLTDV